MVKITSKPNRFIEIGILENSITIFNKVGSRNFLTKFDITRDVNLYVEEFGDKDIRMIVFSNKVNVVMFKLRKTTFCFEIRELKNKSNPEEFNTSKLLFSINEKEMGIEEFMQDLRDSFYVALNYKSEQ